MDKHQQNQPSSSVQRNFVMTAMALYLLNKRKEQLNEEEAAKGYRLAVEPGFPGAGPADFGSGSAGASGAGRGKGDDEDNDSPNEIRNGADIDERMGVGSQSGTLRTSTEDDTEPETEHFSGSSIMKTIRDVFTGGDDSDGASTIGTGGTEHGGATGGTESLPIMEDADEVENAQKAKAEAASDRLEEGENLEVDTITGTEGSAIVSKDIDTHPGYVNTVAGGGSGAGTNNGSSGVGTDPGTWGGTGR